MDETEKPEAAAEVEEEEQSEPEGTKTSIHDRLNAIKQSDESRKSTVTVAKAAEACIG